MKARHEGRCGGDWAKDTQLEAFAVMLLAQEATLQSITVGERARIRIRDAERGGVGTTTRGTGEYG